MSDEMPKLDARLERVSAEAVELIETMLKRDNVDRDVQLAYAVLIIPRLVIDGHEVRVAVATNVVPRMMRVMLAAWADAIDAQEKKGGAT